LRSGRRQDSRQKIFDASARRVRSAAPSSFTAQIHSYYVFHAFSEGLSPSSGREMGSAKEKTDEDEIVPTHTALRLAAQWLGVRADDAVGSLEGVDGGTECSGGEQRRAGAGGRQAHPGLGFGTNRASFESKSKANGAWNRNLDERLMNQKKRKGGEGRGRAETRAAGSESEGEGESRVAMVGTKQKTALTKDQLLMGGTSKKRKQKKK